MGTGCSFPETKAEETEELHLHLPHIFMELSRSWEAASCAATQELTNILRMFITVFTRDFHWSLS
jgi:hypothetical protein